MANALYAKGKQNILDGNIAFDSDTIKVQAIDTALYTVNLATDDALNDISGSALIGTAVALASKTIVDGVFDAADTNLVAVTGASAEALVIYKDSGSGATSWLVAYIDTATGLPFTPNGGDVLIQWDNGANKIFKL